MDKKKTKRILILKLQTRIRKSKRRFKMETKQKKEALVLKSA